MARELLMKEFGCICVCGLVLRSTVNKPLDVVYGCAHLRSNHYVFVCFYVFCLS